MVLIWAEWKGRSGLGNDLHQAQGWLEAHLIGRPGHWSLIRHDSRGRLCQGTDHGLGILGSHSSSNHR